MRSTLERALWYDSCRHWTISAPSTAQRHLEVRSLTSVYCSASCQLQIWDYHKHSGKNGTWKNETKRVLRLFPSCKPSECRRQKNTTHTRHFRTNRRREGPRSAHSPYTDFAATFWYLSTDTYIQRCTRILRSPTMWDMTKIWHCRWTGEHFKIALLSVCVLRHFTTSRPLKLGWMTDIRCEDLYGQILDPVLFLNKPFRGKNLYKMIFFFLFYGLITSLLILKHLVFLVRFRPHSYTVKLPIHDLFEH